MAFNEKTRTLFCRFKHVDHLGIQIPAKDAEIWQYAKDNQFLIVTNDDDFMRLLILKGFPPKIILLRMGNQSNEHVIKLLVDEIKEIDIFEQSDNQGLLEIY